jgi:hypothetical protein
MSEGFGSAVKRVCCGDHLIGPNCFSRTPFCAENRMHHEGKADPAEFAGTRILVTSEAKDAGSGVSVYRKSSSTAERSQPERSRVVGKQGPGLAPARIPFQLPVCAYSGLDRLLIG